MTSRDEGGVPARPSMDEVLMIVAHAFARRSTCSRGQTGAVLALRERVVATGYNGAPAGMPHCDHSCDCPAMGGVQPADRRPVPPGGVQHHHPTCRSMRSCTTAIHAEANAIAFAARHGVALEGATLYCVFSPCRACAQLIIAAGITRVYTTPATAPGDTSVGAGRQLLRDAEVEVDA